MYWNARYYILIEILFAVYYSFLLRIFEILYYDIQVFTNDIKIVWLAICCPIFLYSWMFTHFSLIVQMCLYVHGLVPQLIMGLLLKIKNTNNSCRHPFSTMQKHYRILYLYRPTTLRSLIWHVITIHCNPIFSFR